ncbi:MAG: alkanesulfonate monooxygenase SsuD [Candidatus Azotimanducaceae bacterium]|jgi:alkanesulfonate monooxygenase SsuD/methylene tetrahydromethanopterin reductase-like flavin-dependent oxidoreductase (luciferase family)
MKFGVLQFFSWPERRIPIQEVYARAMERITIMDQGGYDAVWLAEHHFSTYSVCPSVHLMAMHVANHTKNIRIGTGISLAAFYHPLRLAEEVALLDHLSGGRINWGAGRGFDTKEMEVFDVPREESYARFRENVEIVLQAWQDGAMSYQGEFSSFEDVEVLPKPLQDPMPVWMATSTEEAINWSAAQGHAILMDPHSTHTDIGRKRRLYEQGLRDAGHTLKQDIPVARLIAIAETDEKAAQVARAGAEWTVGGYASGKKGGPQSDLSPEQRVNQYVDEVIVHGSPARVADQLLALQETENIDYLLASILSHETFVRLTDEVLPRLA